MPFNPANVLNLQNLDVPIYRIFPLFRFEEMMARKELVLVKPASWTDQYEGFLFKMRAVISGQNVGVGPLLEKIYSQCWMLCSDSEAMWHMYSHPERLPQKWLHRTVYKFSRWLNGEHTHQGVKVRTTPRKLFEAFVDNTCVFEDLCYFMGKVEYWQTTDIDDLMADPSQVQALLLSPDGKGHVIASLIKRVAFEHEQEVRIIFVANRDDFDESQNSFYRFPITPNALFEGVALDPRLTAAECADTEKRIRNAGFLGSIIQSKINMSPNYTVHLNP